VSFSVDNWDAYKVNAGKSETSPTIALTNLGNQAVTITNVKFGKQGFTTTLKQGEEIAAADSKQFTITYNAGHLASSITDSLLVDTEMTVTFSDGSQAVLPVSGITMADDYRYFGFEHDDTGVAPEGFTVMDVDGQSTSPLSFWNFPNNGTPLAFFVLNDSQCYNSLKEPHGHQSLMTRCNGNGAFDDWIVSAPMLATNNTKFDFDARNWESINSVLPAQTPTLQVLVSTTSATDRSSFEQVGYDETLELYDDVAWTHLSYDLKSYAGKRIFVALRASATNCLGAFYDNFEFAHVGLNCDINQDGKVDIADVNAAINVMLGKSENPLADCNGDGKVDIADVNMVINAMLGK
jgi:hypothetical protein